MQIWCGAFRLTWQVFTTRFGHSGGGKAGRGWRAVCVSEGAGAQFQSGKLCGANGSV